MSFCEMVFLLGLSVLLFLGKDLKRTDSLSDSVVNLLHEEFNEGI